MTGVESTRSPQPDGELSRLFTEFRDRVDEQVIREVFERSLEPFATARIKLFVPILSYRHARARLRDVVAGAAADLRIGT